MFARMKTTNAFALRIDLRQMKPAVVACAVTIHASSHEMKEEKESETPKDADPYPLSPRRHGRGTSPARLDFTVQLCCRRF
jgi:hypothetical protein